MRLFLTSFTLDSVLVDIQVAYRSLQDRLFLGFLSTGSLHDAVWDCFMIMLDVCWHI